MALEPVFLSLFLLAAVCGVARFRGKARWDRISLHISSSTSLLGTLLLGISALHNQSSLLLVPLSLLIMLHASTLLLRHYFLQIIGLPLIVAEILGSFFVSSMQLDISPWSLFAGASLFHFCLIAVMLKLISSLDASRTSDHSRWSPYTLATTLCLRNRGWL